jgi:uncharacterized protein (TIGR03643 family)
MKRKKISDYDEATIKVIITVAQEEKKAFEVLREKYKLSETDIVDLMRTKLSKDTFEIWKKKVDVNRPKPKPLKTNPIEDDDLDSKYYFKNKFD